MSMERYIEHVNICVHCDWRIWFHCQIAKEIIDGFEDDAKAFFVSGNAERLVKLIRWNIVYFAMNDKPKVGRIESAVRGRLCIRHADTIIQRPASQCFSTLEEIYKWLNQ